MAGGGSVCNMTTVQWGTTYAICLTRNVRLAYRRTCCSPPYFKQRDRNGNPAPRRGAKPRSSILRGSRATERRFVLVDHARSSYVELTDELAEIASERTPREHAGYVKAFHLFVQSPYAQMLRQENAASKHSEVGGSGGRECERRPL
jgi:hypothetical protein